MIGESRRSRNRPCNGTETRTRSMAGSLTRLCKSSDTADSQVTKVPVDMGTLGMPITRMSNIQEGLEAGCRKSRALGRLSSVLTCFGIFEFCIQSFVARSPPRFQSPPSIMSTLMK